MNNTIRPTIIYALLSEIKFLIPIVPIRIMVLMVSQNMPDWVHLTSIIFALIYVYKVMLVRSNYYFISKDLIIFTRGVFSISEDYVEIYRIKDFRKKRPFHLRIIGCMNIDIVSSDRSLPLLVLKGIPQLSIINSLRLDVENLRKIKRVYEIDSQ